MDAKTPLKYNNVKFSLLSMLLGFNYPTTLA